MKTRMGDGVYVGCQLCGMEDLFDSVEDAHNKGWYIGKESDLCPRHASVMVHQMGLRGVPNPPENWKEG